MPGRLDSIKGIRNEFWKKALWIYLENKALTQKSEVTANNFLNQLLWNNMLVKYKNQTLFLETWKKNGIERIRDIVSPSENRILLLEEVQDKLNQNRAKTFMEYNAVINAIPSQWKEWINEDN